MNRQLNEFNTGYPTTIGNAQSQEYQGVLGPIDAETVQGKDRFNLTTTEGLHRLNVFINHFFQRPTLNPHYEIAQLKTRLNHLQLDFDFDNSMPIEPTMTFKVHKGRPFGTTPTTDLSKGFDTGTDLPEYTLTITTQQIPQGFKMEGKLSPASQLGEEVKPKEDKNKDEIKYIESKKEKRNKRVNKLREIIIKKKDR